MTTEGMVWLNIPDVDRQWVPGGGTCDSERAVGNMQLKPGFHYPSWRPELTGDRFPLPVNTGSGNRAWSTVFDWISSDCSSTNDLSHRLLSSTFTIAIKVSSAVRAWDSIESKLGRLCVCFSRKSLRYAALDCTVLYTLLHSAFYPPLNGKMSISFWAE